MKVFTRDYRITGDYHPLWDDYFAGMKPCVFDIETTGLSRDRCRVVLAGLLTRTDSGVRATQFLAENHYEEGKVLEALMDFIRAEDIGLLITYNGESFDVPFVNARLRNNFMEGQLGLYDFDLFRMLKTSSDLKQRTGSLSQKSVEDHYGILSDRGDTISGRESVLLFDQYSVSGSSTIEKIILTHNREDIAHLNRLMYAALSDFPDGNLDGEGFACFHSAMAAHGLPAAGGRLIISPKICPAGRSSSYGYELRVSGRQLREPVSCAFFPDICDPVTAVFNSETSLFEITLPVQSAEGIVGNDEYKYYLDLRSIGLSSETENITAAESSSAKAAGREYDHSAVTAGSGSADGPVRIYDNGGGTAGCPAPERDSGLADDPDCVNGYLILNPRTINLAARYITEKVYKKIRTQY